MCILNNNESMSKFLYSVYITTVLIPNHLSLSYNKAINSKENFHLGLTSVFVLLKSVKTERDVLGRVSLGSIRNKNNWNNAS